MGAMLIGCVASCGQSTTRPNGVASEPVPDTVALPDMLSAMSTPLAARADHTIETATALQQSASPEPTSASDAPAPTAPVPTDPVSTDPVSTDPVLAEPEPALLMAATGSGSPTGRVDGGLRHATLDFTGDTLIHSPIVNRARTNATNTAVGGYDFSPMFARVGPILAAADLAICHLETPVAPPGQPLSTYPMYGIPAQIADGLAAAGYDRCSTASNHTIDRGTGGIDATVAALEQAGLSQAGMARTPDEAVATLVEAGGITIAHLSYTYGFNGARLPAGEPWRSNPIDVGRIIVAADDARARGAEIVILNLHWGTEGSSDISKFQRETADAITRSGAVDLIVGEHAHVIQPIEQVNGTWVVYGMGNFLSNMPTGTFPAKTQDGMIVSVSFSERADGSIAVEPPVVIPTWVDRRDGFVIRPVLADLADPNVSAAVKDLLYASLQRTGEVVGGFVGATVSGQGSG